MGIRDGMTPEEQDAFEKWAQAQRETNIKGMAQSAFVFSLYPKDGEFDVDFALQLGAMLMLEKPVLMLIEPGQEIPAKVRAVADEILEVSTDDIDLGGATIAAKIKEFMERHELVGPGSS